MQNWDHILAQWFIYLVIWPIAFVVVGIGIVAYKLRTIGDDDPFNFMHVKRSGKK